ncbi:Tn3 family transposase [Enterobacter roggenkampii]|uniref:Tn3 family transposase n=1 Tax=Enterobacter roggenkampii TaxID=1812935 RepID=UPI0021BC0C44|nr:Tn3 family transposase [Enterobacter roggenkampii]
MQAYLLSGDTATVWCFRGLHHLLLHFEEVGDEEKAAITRQVSPVAWQNINLSGTYQFASNRKLPDLQEITRPIVENEV